MERIGANLARRALQVLLTTLIFAPWAITRTDATEPPAQSQARSLKGDDLKRVRTLDRRIEQLKKAGKFVEAVEPAQEVLAIRRRVLGTENWRTEDARLAVEDLKRIAGLPEEGRKAVASLADLEDQFSAMKSQGRIAEAEPLSRSILEICTRWLGADHPRTARSYSRVATVLESQRRYGEAERLGREALAIWLKSMRKDHPDTVGLYNNLAITLYPQGKYRESESLFRENLSILARLGWPDDMRTALSLHNLAKVVLLKRRFSEAEPLLRRAVSICVKLNKVDSPESALFHGNLASVLDLMGKVAEAEPLLRTQMAG
jgi:tetratricopeptide (TPR) repeat protein